MTLESDDLKIKLIDSQTLEVEAFPYAPEDTILDLKHRVAHEKSYEDKEGTKIQLFWAFVPLKNNELVENYVNKEEGIFVHFEEYPVECKATGNVFVWLGKKKCVRLYAGVAENLPIPRNGHFAVMRSK